jgi:multisubunit Na+/H+ antiporter MnhG subunit
MSKLQKAAWFNLGLVTTSGLIAILCFTLAASKIEKGFNYINAILCSVTFCIIVPVTLIIAKKKSYEAGFDEREKSINERATTLSLSGSVIFLYLACFIPFVALGGGNIIKVVYLPVIFICTVFAGQLIKSIAIIARCALEKEDGQ